MKITELAWNVFNKSIQNYHIQDDINQEINNPYNPEDLEHLFYLKNWIDTVQWHLEDVIRDPQINPDKALNLKRWIDSSNQLRTDTVEMLDTWFEQQFKDVKIKENAKINTESPAWAFDRLSILALKIFHMAEQVNRTDSSKEHIQKCSEKLHVLKTQHSDLSIAIEELLVDFKQGNKYMKSYKQMKMYNDEELNPILYKGKI